MSIKYNGKVIAGNYKSQIIKDADTVNSGKIRIATQSEVDVGTNNTTAITPLYLTEGLNKKQNNLTAGEGIKIENDVISTESTKILTDNETIVQNSDNTITTIGQKTKADTIMINWEGTQAEYEAGLAHGTILSDWYCYITDDETIVDFNDFANNSLSNLSDAGQAVVDYKASIDLDNLSEVGEKHFLNKQQITNCLTEVPQRIKYTLVDGTLTIKAGSVVIVPYGTDDLTDTYPIGSTLLNDNFKVVDTQFVDSKFFVWAELQNDTASKFGYSDLRVFWIEPSINILAAFPTTCAYSGDTAPTAQQYMYWYDTANNLVKGTVTTGSTWGPALTLPIVIAQTGSDEITSVNQVFNGMGYIGSTVWVDKGVKGLIPDGRNADGTLRNIEYLNDELKTYDNSGVTNVSRMFVLKQNGTFSRALSYKVNDDGYLVNSDGIYTDGFVFGDSVFGSNSITSFNPKQPFRAADAQDIDGTYTYSPVVALASQSTLAVGSGVKVDYDISAYLPNDGNSYLVMTHVTIQTGNTTSAYCHVWTASSDNIFGVSSGGNTTDAVRQTFLSKGWTLVRPDRILRTYRSCSGSAGTLVILEISSYRKVR